MQEARMLARTIVVHAQRLFTKLDQLHARLRIQRRMRSTTEQVLTKATALQQPTHDFNMPIRAIMTRAQKGNLGWAEGKLLVKAPIKKRQRLQWLYRRTTKHRTRHVAEGKQKLIRVPHGKRPTMPRLDPPAAGGDGEDWTKIRWKARHHGTAWYNA
jgi:hypothetical protein